MSNLGPQKINNSYLGLLQVEGGITTALKPVTDGLGVATPWELSSTSVGFSSLSMSGSINMNGNSITGLATPVFATDAATKAYVDSVAAGLQPKTQAKAATLSDITLSGEQTIDGVAIVAGDRVLVKNQASQAQNGIYVASASAWSRSSDADTWSELVGAYIFVYQGSQAASSWACNIPPSGTLGTTAVTWINFSSSTSTLANYLTFTGVGNGDEGVSDIADEAGQDILTESSEFLIIQTPASLAFNGSSPLTISYNSIGAIALDGSNASPGSTWNIDILGNAGSVTDGVYTSGSYSDPSWITAIASSKLVGAVSVNNGGTGATSLTGVLFGNGASAVTSATAGQIVATIGATAVQNATNAVSATTATTATTASVATTTTQTDFSNLTINGNQVPYVGATWAMNISGNSATTSQTNFSNLTIAGSQVVSAANIGTYAPKTYINVAQEYGKSGAGLAAALAAIAADSSYTMSRTLYCQAGLWEFTSNVLVTVPCTIVGDGVHTIFYPAGSNITCLTLQTGAAKNPVHIDNIYFVGNTSLGNTNVKAISVTTNTEGHVFTRLVIEAFNYGFYFLSGYYWNITNCFFGGHINAAIYVSNTINTDNGDSSIIGSSFEMASNQGYAIEQESSGGLKIIGNKFINGVIHWYCRPSGGNALNDGHFIGNSSESASTAHIYFDGNNAPIDNFVISGNQFSLDNAPVTGILLNGSQNYRTTITDNEIWVRLANQTGIYVGNGGNDGVAKYSIKISGNNISGTNASSQTGISIDNPAYVHVGVNNIAANASSNTNSLTAYAIGSPNVKFDVGQTCWGTVSGSAVNSYGSLWIWNVPSANIVFTPPFPTLPKVSAIATTGAGGAVGVIVDSLTTSGCRIAAVGVTAGGFTTVDWTASIVGQ